MKKLMMLSVLILAVQVKAVPPPPPLPEAAGYLIAKISMKMNAINNRDCNGYFCQNESRICEITARIPVVELPGSGEDGYPMVNQSADGKQSAMCDLEFGGFKHLVTMSVYAVQDKATGNIKVVADTHTGKFLADGDTSMDSANRSITVIAASLPSYSVKGSQYLSAYAGSQKKNTLANTSSRISTEINFSSLTIEAPEGELKLQIVK